jgi:hypothetical protein
MPTREWMREWVSEWVSEWFLFNAKWAIAQLYHGDQVAFGEMMYALLNWIFIVLAHRNHKSAVRRLAPLGHSILIDRYHANYYFLFLDNAACLAEKQQISIILEHANAHN